ncbi:MAG: ABC transporter permease [Candidatus Eisenbacteria bacterium]|uniref:ABC transporter permease n=1 Tax=Eiseniibacteriota bacterium TaxID=2212470 RepID=A0A849SEA0_UNCEI|nr:ABC transporter permease [Candidatus Eisenbacteria bacterium]
MNLPFWIAARYLKTRRQSGFITLLTAISIGGVAVGVMALLVVLAVMNGFESEVQTRIAGTDAHIVLLGHDTAGLRDPEAVMRRARRVAGVVGVAPFTYAKAMVFHGGFAEGVVVKGVDLARENDVTSIARNLTPVLARLGDGAGDALPEVALGSEVVNRLSITVGDTVLLATFTGSGRSVTGYQTKLRRFVLAAIFRSGLYTYDSSFGFVSIPAAQEFFGLGTSVTGVAVRLRDMFDAPATADRILVEVARPGSDPGEHDSGDPTLRANNWMDLNRNLFTWMKLEKAVMFLILALIVLVAAFSIVSTLFMVVSEKRRDIGVLKSLGASRALILRIFLVEGLLIGGFGVTIGTGLGGLAIALLARYPIVTLPGDVYFIERLPVRPEAPDFIAVILATVGLCLAAALYPAWRASLLDPVEAIRRQA